METVRESIADAWGDVRHTMKIRLVGRGVRLWSVPQSNRDHVHDHGHGSGVDDGVPDKWSECVCL